MIQIFFYVLFPWIAVKLCQKIKFLGMLSPLALCYPFGMLLAALPNFIDTNTAESAAKIAVVVAIPFMLLATRLEDFATILKKTVLCSSIFFFIVTLFATSGGVFFSSIDPDAWMVAGMLAGTYIGSSPNLAAVGTSLNVPSHLFVLAQTVDILVSGVLFFFILTIGPNLIGKILRQERAPEHPFSDTTPHRVGMNFIDFLKTLILSAVIIILSYGISRLVPPNYEQFTIFMSISALAIVLSQIPAVQSIQGSYHMGENIFLIFCTAVGSMTKLEQVFVSGPTMFYLAGFIVFGSFIFHIFLCRLLKFDRDTSIVAAMAGIFSPAMIGPIVSILGNKKLFAPAMASALLSLGVGSGLGLGVSFLVKYIVG